MIQLPLFDYIHYINIISVYSKNFSILTKPLLETFGYLKYQKAHKFSGTPYPLPLSSQLQRSSFLIGKFVIEICFIFLL